MDPSLKSVKGLSWLIDLPDRTRAPPHVVALGHGIERIWPYW